MTIKKSILMLLLVISGILHAQDMERWLWIKPGRENSILREPVVGKSPTGLLHRYFFEGRGTKLRNFCKDFREDLALQEKQAKKEKSGKLLANPPSNTEMTSLQEKLLQAAIAASSSGDVNGASNSYTP